MRAGSSCNTAGAEGYRMASVGQAVSLALRTGAAHGSLLRQFGEVERTVDTCDTALTTVESLPPCSTRVCYVLWRINCASQNLR